MSGQRQGYDLHPHLCALWREAIAGTFKYPDYKITAQEFKAYAARKNQAEPDPMLAFVGFGCSFGGDWFHGYARNGVNRPNADTQRESTNSIKRKAAAMQGVDIQCRDYRTLEPKGALIYADPPYAGTVGYGGVGDFDGAEFWDVARRWAATGNRVFVSEYAAPVADDIREVWRAPHTLGMRTAAGGAERRVEKLFEVIK